MSAVGERERAVQNRAIDLFRDTLGYEYLGNWHDRLANRPVEEALLTAWLQTAGHSPDLVRRAVDELVRAASDQSRSLYDTNRAVYEMLRYGVKVKPDAGVNHVTVHLIDWAHPERNAFAVAEEVTVTGQHTKRPDLVLYVNGIALGVLELKRSSVSVSEGIRQNLDNQREVFIRSFFSTIQFVMAGNETEGLRYGTIETPEKHFLTWKEGEAGGPQNILHQHLIQLCRKERLLELIHDFVVFDSGVKKLARHNQYFGVRAAQQHLCSRQGGIIWHTQGSGKSLTMVWLAKWIREHLTDARVLIVTDRLELDEQIEKVFRGVDEQIVRTVSGNDLIDRLNRSDDWLLCSLIHKFAGREEGDVEGFVSELRRSLPAGFRARGNLVVFVDECHRTQSGVLHEAMTQILPEALFIGFTGTPLLKADKQRSIEVFGSYIHTYRYDEAVRDRVVLDLRYEARDIDQSLTSPAKIDQWFAAKTRGLNDVAMAQLKQKWGTMQKVLSSRDRLQKIVADILLDMETRDRLMSGRGNALLVMGSIYQACRIYEMFVSNGFDRCAIVTSYKPGVNDLKGETTGEGTTEQLQQYDIYRRMLNGRTPEDFEKEIKKRFIEQPGQMKLLIVVDKLLTGFDAPPATYLYIDKPMRDHGLFQAICRVNRLDGDDKEYGYVIDYKDLFQSLKQSVEDYTSGAFDGFDHNDVAGLLSNRLEKARERLEECREAIRALCEPVERPKDMQAYIRHFCGNDHASGEALKETETRRLALYRMTVALLRSYANLASEMTEAGYTTEEAERIRREVEHYEALRNEIKLASGDYIDLTMYEPAMRHLIDTYIRAEDSVKMSAFNDLTLVQLIIEKGADAVHLLPEDIASSPEAVAETIENNLRRVILEEEPINPKYYDTMSALLDALIEERRSKALDYREYLQRIEALAGQVMQPMVGKRYPPELNTPARRALYDNLDGDASLAVRVDQAILLVRKDDWRGNVIKEREVKGAIRRYTITDELTLRILELAKQQSDY